MKLPVKIALGIVTAMALTSWALYLKQGGLGIGREPFDPIIVTLGFPWVLLPWPEALTERHPVFLIIGLTCSPKTSPLEK